MKKNHCHADAIAEAFPSSVNIPPGMQDLSEQARISSQGALHVYLGHAKAQFPAQWLDGLDLLASGLSPRYLFATKIELSQCPRETVVLQHKGDFSSGQFLRLYKTRSLIMLCGALSSDHRAEGL